MTLTKKDQEAVQLELAECEKGPSGSSPFAVKYEIDSANSFDEAENRRFEQANKLIKNDIVILLPDCQWVTDTLAHWDRFVKKTRVNGVAVYRWRFLAGLPEYKEVVNDIIIDTCQGFLTSTELASAKKRMEYKASEYKPYVKKPYQPPSYLLLQPSKASKFSQSSYVKELPKAQHGEVLDDCNKK